MTTFLTNASKIVITSSLKSRRNTFILIISNKVVKLKYLYFDRDTLIFLHSFPLMYINFKHKIVCAITTTIIVIIMSIEIVVCVATTAILQ